VRITFAGGADDPSRGERELRLHLTDERVAQGEAVMQKLRAFLQEHPTGGSAGLGAQQRVAQQRSGVVPSLFAPRSSPRGAPSSPTMVHPPMRFAAN
jgi:hypothetical protein